MRMRGDSFPFGDDWGEMSRQGPLARRVCQDSSSTIAKPVLRRGPRKDTRSLRPRTRLASSFGCTRGRVHATSFFNSTASLLPTNPRFNASSDGVLHRSGGIRCLSSRSARPTTLITGEISFRDTGSVLQIQPFGTRPPHPHPQQTPVTTPLWEAATSQHHGARD